MNKAKICFFDQINKINKSLARLVKKKIRKITNSYNKRGISKDLTDKSTIIKVYT